MPPMGTTGQPTRIMPCYADKNPTRSQRIIESGSASARTCPGGFSSPGIPMFQAPASLLRFLSALIAAFHGLENQEQHEDESDTDAGNHRPCTFPGGHVPEPPPVQCQMEENREDKQVTDPCVQVTPFVAVKTERGEPPATAGSRRKAERQQKSRTSHGAETQPEEEIEKTGKNGSAGGLVCGCGVHCSPSPLNPRTTCTRAVCVKARKTLWADDCDFMGQKIICLSPEIYNLDSLNSRRHRLRRIRKSHERSRKSLTKALAG